MIISPARLGLRFGAALLMAAFFLPDTDLTAQQLQQFVTPGPNMVVNGKTPNPNTLRIPDFFRKQQHEPACVQSTDNPNKTFCAFNDCRASDWDEVLGDCWIGVGQSNDGETWTSRLAPGYKLHPYNLNMGFAADPTVRLIPGRPGPEGNGRDVILLSWIASFRDSDQGLIVTQRYIESPLEDGEWMLPEDRPPTVIATGSEGRFHDKVHAIFIADEPGSQTTVTETVDVESIPDPVIVNRVGGTDIIAYSVFTGNGSAVKVLTQRSTNGGLSYEKSKKVSDELNTVTGVHLTHIPGKGTSLVYRRSRDSNELDAIVGTFSGNLARTWTKTKTIFEICPHDQQASGATFRNFTFPWSANDGERFWVLSADKVDPVTGQRVFKQGLCQQVPGAPPGTYPGIPKIVGMSSLDGRNWFGSVGSQTEPFILTGDVPGFHVLPFAQGAKGRVDIGFWSTQEEEVAVRPLPNVTELPLIYDYLTYDNGVPSRVFRKASIYTTRIDGCADEAGGACTPRQPSADGFLSPVRVSRYPTVQLSDGTLQELQANPLNLRTHGSGTLAYNGDYGTFGTRQFRRVAKGALAGELVQNSLPKQSGEEGFVAQENTFMAWGDARDVDGVFVADPADQNAQLPYGPPENAAPALQAPGLQAKRAEPAGGEAPEVRLAASPVTEEEDSLKAVGEPDDALGLPPNADLLACGGANGNTSRSRDLEVIGTLVEDVPSLVALTQARQMNTVQRMFPVSLSYPGTAQPGANFCLEIENQPVDAIVDGFTGLVTGSGRASFDPLPARNAVDGSPVRTRLDVFVPPVSSAYRSVFVTSSDPATRITVSAYEGGCNAIGALISTVQLGNGQLFDPVFCQENPTEPACQETVVNSESHNISLAAPAFQAPALQAPILQATLLGAPALQAEGLPAPGFQADGLDAPALQAPSLQAPGYQAPGLQAETLLSPGLQAPSLQAPSLQAALPQGDVYYADLSYLLATNTNVTTTYSADIAVVGLDSDESEIELIAWQPNVHTTTRVVGNGCQAVPEADNKVIAAVNLGSPGLQASSLGDVSLPVARAPDDQTPYAGEITFSGIPGDRVALTVRMWVTGQAKATVDRLYSCKTTGEPADPADPRGPCQPFEIENGIESIVAFGAAAHGCSTIDVDTGTPGEGGFDPTIDCISTGFERIQPRDLLPPQFDPPDGGTVEYEAESPAGATVNTPGTVPDGITVTDQDPDVTVTCFYGGTDTPLPDGTTLFPFGDTDIYCTAVDSSGNEANASLTIAVVDTFDPVLTVPAPITAEATSPAGAAVDFVVSATDATATTLACTIPDGSGGTLDVTSGYTFPLGTTTVSCTATDQGGNTATDSFDVTVADTQPPEVTVPPDTVFADAVDANGAVVDYVATATDETNLTFVCTPASGSTFPLGTTTVSCTATDQGGNSTTATFDVTVTDNGDPTITVPGPITEEASGPDGAAVSFTVTATDAIDASVAVECTVDAGATIVVSGDTFPLGTTTVSCTATDDAGNTDTASFVITVEDTTAPVFSPALVDITETATGPAGAPVSFTATATDAVDQAVDVSCTIPDGSGGSTTVVSGDTFPRGTTTVTCTATDNGRFGDDLPPLNTTTDSFDVTVELGATGITPKQNPNKLKTGTSIPLVWAWLDASGTPVDVGAGNQMFEVYSESCADQPGILVFDEDPGSSGFQLQADSSYQFNFLAKEEQTGADLPAERTGTPYCAIVTLYVDGVAVQQQDGDLKLKP